MALLFMDGFDAADFARKYDNWGGLLTSTSTRFGAGLSGRLTTGGGGGGPFVTKYLAASQTVWIGLAYSADYGGINFLSTYGDGGLTNHINVRYVNSTTVAIFRGSTELGRSASVSFSAWRYYELGVHISDIDGWAKLYIDGAEAINYSGDTKNGGTNNTIDRFSLFAESYGANAYIDDLYVNDADRHGDVRVQTLSPNAAGASTQFTPTGAANYTNVAEIPDNTATFNSSSTQGHRDTYGLTDLLANTGTVLGVQTNITARKTDAGLGPLKEAIYTGGTVYYGDTVQLPSSLARMGNLREINPATGLAWTVSDVNALEGGAEVA